MEGPVHAAARLGNAVKLSFAKLCLRASIAGAMLNATAKFA